MVKLLEADIFYANELNPKIWRGFELKPEVSAKLKEIAYAFVEYVNLPEMDVVDIKFCGSNVDYNYHSQSDIDLHIITDFAKIIDGNPDIPPLEDFFFDKKKIFNDEHNIFIYGLPVELYVEDIKEPAKSNGAYSILHDKWITKPKKLDVMPYKFLDEKELDLAIQDVMKEIDDVLSSEYNTEEAKEILGTLYKNRQLGLATFGEFSNENIIFKTLRNNGYLDKLRKYIKQNQDKKLSLP